MKAHFHEICLEKNMWDLKMKILWFLFVLVSVAGKREEKSGPFRSTLLSASRCQNTTYPMEKDTPLLIYMGVGEASSSGSPRTRTLHGNVTVLRETKQVRVKIKTFSWDGSKWKMMYLMNLASCNGRLMELFCKAINLNVYDGERCAFTKGTNVFHDIDINKMQHMFTSRMEYGRLLWRSEVNGGMTTFQCWEYQTVVEKA